MKTSYQYQTVLIQHQLTSLTVLKSLLDLPEGNLFSHFTTIKIYVEMNSEMS